MLLIDTSAAGGNVTQVAPSSIPLLASGIVLTINGGNIGNGSDIIGVFLAGVPVEAILQQTMNSVVVRAASVVGSTASFVGDVRVLSASRGNATLAHAIIFNTRTQQLTASTLYE